MSGTTDLANKRIALIGPATATTETCARWITKVGAAAIVLGGQADAEGGWARVLNAEAERSGCLDAVVVVSPTLPPRRSQLDTKATPVPEAVAFDPIDATLAALAALRVRGRGRLVLVASGPASPLPGHPQQSAADGALFGLARALGPESESGQVIVNAVAPIVDSPTTASFFDAHPYLERDRFGPDIVGAVVALLCDDRCPLRGQVLSAGGGRVARVATVTAAGVMEVVPQPGGLVPLIEQACSVDRPLEPRTVLDELLLVEV